MNERVDCVFTCEVRGGAVRSEGGLWAGWRAGSLTPGSKMIDKQTVRQIDRKMRDESKGKRAKKQEGIHIE